MKIGKNLLKDLPLKFTAATLPDPASLAVGAMVNVDGSLVVKNGGLSPLPTSAELTTIMVSPLLPKVLIGDGSVSLTIGAVAGAAKYEALINDALHTFDSYGAKTIAGLTNGVPVTVSVRAVSADGVNTEYTVWPKTVTPNSHIFSAFDAKLEAWFDADTLTAFPWLDKSGNGCRGNAVNAMTINSTWANGHKSAVFSGASANSPYVQTDVPVTSGVKAIFIVYDITAATNGSSKREQAVLTEGELSGIDFFALDNYASSGNAIRILNSTSYANPAGQVITAGVVNTVSIAVTGGMNAGIYHNGTKATAYPQGLAGNSASWVIGNNRRSSGNQLYGNVAEVIIFDGLLTDAQRWAVEDYLNIKYTGSAKAHV